MKNNSKLKTILLCVLSFMLGSITIVSANEAIQALLNQSITIMLNGEEQQFKDSLSGANQYPITYNDRTYLPLRNVAEIAGLSVDYDSETNTAYLNEKDLHLLGHLDFENKLDSSSYIVKSGVEKRFDYKISEEGKSITVSTNGVNNTIPTNLTKRIASFSSSGINLLDANAFEIPKCIFVVMTDDGCIYESLLTNADLKNVEVLTFFPIVSGANSFNLTFNTQTLGYTLIYYDDQLNWTHIKKLPLITNTEGFDKYFITKIEGYYNEEFRNRLFDVDLDGINDLYYTESLYGKQLMDINMNEASNFFNDDKYIIIQTKTGVYCWNESEDDLFKLEKDVEKNDIIDLTSVFSHSFLNEKDIYFVNYKLCSKETFEEEYNKFSNSEQILKSYPMINSFSELDFEL